MGFAETLTIGTLVLYSASSWLGLAIMAVGNAASGLRSARCRRCDITRRGGLPRLKSGIALPPAPRICCIKATMVERMNRRDLLLKCAALGGLTLGPVFRLPKRSNGAHRRVWSGRRLPGTSSDRSTRRTHPTWPRCGWPAIRGLPLSVSGQVFDTRGNAIEGATLEVWQANDAGLVRPRRIPLSSGLVADRAASTRSSR